MSKIEKSIDKIFKFLASLQLAVIIIIALGVISAVGTIVEAQNDAIYAQKIIYHSAPMYLIMALLCVNLFNVMIDRLPWKKHHSGFVFAHIGIILLIVGSLVTRIWGVDGSLPIDLKQKNRYVLIPAETEFAVYSTYGSGGYKQMHKTIRDFLTQPVSEDDPYVVQLGNEKLEILDYHYAAIRKESIVEDTRDEGGAVRLQLQNANVNMVEWILRDRKNEADALELGPARILLADKMPQYQGKNEIYLVPTKDQQKLNYYIFTKSKGGLTGKGVVQPGDVVNVGWMGLELRLLKYLPKAQFLVEYEPVKKPVDGVTTHAMRMRFKGEEHWVGLNSSLRLYTDNLMYLVSYANRRIDLGFEIQLDKFTVGRYQGTMRAASYASDVQIPGVLEAHISMNNPLKHGGFTFYQASFQEDDAGNPTTSILSVNYDPGRWLKYLGSLLIVLGSILMFYFKQMIMRSSK